MEKYLISVVLPIYKTEAYLNECVESIVNQSYRNLEIILVDDGSPDSCPQICDDWATRDSRIKVIHKENGGLSSARNAGIEVAKGDYICFYDSDDYVRPGIFEKCIKRIKEEDAEIVVYGLVDVDSNGNYGKEYIPYVGAVTYRGEQVLNSFLPDLMAPNPNVKYLNPSFRMTAWTALYSRKIIVDNNWRFVSERQIMSEDVYSLLELYSYVNCVTILPEALYCYRNNATSVSRGYRPDRYEKIKVFYKECLALCDRLNYNDNIRHRVSKPYIGFTIAAMKQEVAVHKTWREKRARLKMIIDDELLQKTLKQNRHDHVGIPRAVLFFAVRHRLYSLCIALFNSKL